MIFYGLISRHITSSASYVGIFILFTTFIAYEKDENMRKAAVYSSTRKDIRGQFCSNLFNIILSSDLLASKVTV